MKNYIVYIPLIATASYEVQAIDEADALEKASQAYKEGDIDLMGFDNEENGQWWIEEE